MIEREVPIINKLGLHARAAAKLVSAASGFAAHVEIAKDGQRVNGKSIMGVMMLAASNGSTIRLSVDGEDEQAAMEALVALVADRFGEPE